MNEVDDWQPVGQDDWKPVGGSQQSAPEAFADRVTCGAAFMGAAQKVGRGTASSIINTDWDALIEHGIINDPYTGRPGMIHGRPLVSAKQAALDEALSSDLIRVIRDMATLPQRAFQQSENLQKEGEFDPSIVLEMGMLGTSSPASRLGRAAIAPDRPAAQEVGGLPARADFDAAAAVVNGNPARFEALWDERGIHPAEAAHDAQTDAFLKHDLAAPITRLEPHEDAAFLAKIADGQIAMPSSRDLDAIINNAHSAENAGISPEVERKIARLNSRIDAGGRDADVAMSEKDALLKTLPENLPGERLEGPTAETLRALKNEFEVLERSPLETGETHADGIARVLKRYVSKAADGDEFARAVMRKGLYEAHQNGLDSGAIGGDTIGKLLSQLSSSDRAFMERTLAQQLAPKPRGIGAPHPLDQNASAQGPLGSEGGFNSLGAAATEPKDLPPSDIPFSQQPPPPPGRIAAAVQATTDKMFDIGKDIQMLVSPMATGTTETMAVAKDFANGMRRNRWEWSREDTSLVKEFNPEQRKRMWQAADEESVARQLGESTEHQGLTTLTPAERAKVEELQGRAQVAWLRAHDIGLVEGEGLPAYTPRMVINTANALAEDKALPLNGIGGNVRVSSPNLRQRKYMTAEETEAAAKAKYGEQAEIARDIRTLPLATAKLEDAIAGRSLINQIKEIGKSTGDETVAEGAIPAGSEHKWFTIDHPAFRTWRPQYEREAGGAIKLNEDGKVQAVKDADGNTLFEQVPLYIRDDFEGPLRAVLSTKSGPLYQSMMSIKGKTMSLIMNSPMIHNAVEFGRAFPAMPTRIVKAYFDGYRAKNDVPLMREAIDNGLVPIGKRFFKQDIDSIMEAPDLTPGRSWTAKIAGAVPGLFDPAAEVAVKRAIDKAGDFWHNTLLWDRIADLQMGLYVNFRGDMIAKGIDAQTSSRIAAHLANRYAGALPKEAMSDGATKIANLMLFSRTFTIGNLGVMKDALTGLPKDVMAQIERDMGTVNPKAAGYAKAVARRKAIATVALDIGLMYVGNSILQNAFNVMLGDSTLDKEMHGYVKRARDVMNDVNVHPLSLLQPFDIAEKLSATSENEPGRKDRIKIGYAKDGTAIYARNPVGKIGEEFVGYLSSPLDMLHKKQGTIARPMLQVYSNDRGFGRKIFDPNADTPAKYAGNIWSIVQHLVRSQVPEGQINALSDLVRGEGDPKTNTLQGFGPVAGVTFSKGAPGGPAVGELYKAREIHDYQVQSALPDIRRQMLRGDMQGARQRMNELAIPPGLQRFYERTTLNPSTRLKGRALQDFYRYATPAQRQRMEDLRSTGPLAAPLQ